jgi:hypothetical protein
VCYEKFGNINIGNSEEWLQIDACEVDFQHITDIVHAAAKQKIEEEDGEDESETCTALRSSVNSSQI